MSQSLGTGFGTSHVQVLHLNSPTCLAGLMTLSKTLNFLSLILLICKMEIITAIIGISSLLWVVMGLK